MGALFGIIFLGIIGIGGLLFIFLLWAYGKKTGNKIPFQASIVLSLAACTFIIFSFVIGFIPSYAFYSNFGFWPTQDVTSIYGYTLSVFDSGESSMTFHASKDTLNRIITDKQFKEIEESELDGMLPLFEGEHSSIINSKIKYYEAENFGKGFSNSSRAAMSFNEDTKLVHFHWIGID